MRAGALLLVLIGLARCGGASSPDPIPCDFELRCPGGMRCDPAMMTCVEPVPVVSCEAPKSTCGSDCVDTSRSSAHCGGCGKSCAGTCSGGTCTPVMLGCVFCPPDAPCNNGGCDCAGRGTFCSAFCADTTQSIVSCGGCLKICTGGGQVCRAGVCTCPPGQLLCGMSCTPTVADPKNCGACGKTCATGEKCESGVCVAACAIYNLANACSADGKCWDLMTDKKHCGATCKSCSTDMSCDAGTCACPPGTTTCSSSCYDLQRDPLHCGTCAKACGKFEHCTAGACGCLPGLSSCSGACTDLQSDGANCGACGTPCAAGQSCLNGQCAASCAAPKTVCGSSCPDLTRSPQHCGSCTTSCSAGTRCMDSKCGGVSPARGCTTCPCDDCDFVRGAWLCCGGKNPQCVNAYRCPEPL